MKTKLVSGIATGALLLGAFAPSAFAATSVTVNGNGSGSSNKAVAVNKTKVKTTQVNLVGVVNLTSAVSNTGGNHANNNTGSGSVSVNSGDASNTVTNTTTAGANQATVAPCGCDMGDTTIDVKNNGNNSSNNAKVVNKSSSKTTQFNGVFVLNGTQSVSDTGGNSANNNTGDGGVSVTSGDAMNMVSNDTTAGGNTL